MSHYETKEEATRVARQVKAMLDKPSAWKIHVWENTGWHGKLECKGLTLYWQTSEKNRPTDFSTLLSADETGGGEVYWTTRRFFKTPKAAVLYQLQVANKFNSKCSKVVKNIIEKVLAE